MEKHRILELCESRGGRPGLPVPDSHYGLCGREVTLLNERLFEPTYSMSDKCRSLRCLRLVCHQQVSAIIVKDLYAS